MSYYPKHLVHPAYRASEIKPVVKQVPGTGKTITDYHGTPDRYPPVTVNNEDQEARHRAMGYLEFGEAPPKMTAFNEYPLVLTHPEYLEPTAPETLAKRDENNALTTWTIKGSPGAFLPVTVNSPEEERGWASKGYRRPGLSDPAAVEAAKAAPYDPARVIQEFPKMVDGEVVDPAATFDTHQKYPIWAHGVVVTCEHEHREKFPDDFANAPPVPAVDGDSEVLRLRQENAALLAKLTAAEKPKADAPRPRKRVLKPATTDTAISA